MNPAAPTGTAAATGKGTGTATRPKHVDELDVVRVLTFACVIGVHAVSISTRSGGETAGGFLIMLHFTREAFFWLTGFVLTLNYGRRRIDVPHFWRRRLQLVGIPYVLWSLFYCWIDRIRFGTPAWPWGVVRDLAYGTSYYHLYFLLVSLQIYLLFPLIAVLIRRTARHHVALLVVAVLVQAVLLARIQWYGPYTGWAAAFNAHESALFWNYGFWVLFGAVVAWHIDTVRTWLDAHARAVVAAFVVAAAITVTYYLWQVARGETVSKASAVLQPIMLFWVTAVIGALLVIGRRYVRVPQGRTVRKVVTVASDRSFAVFLAHPLVIWLVVQYRDPWAAQLPNPWRSIVVYVLAVVGSALIAEVLRRSPLSLVLAGRPMARTTLPGRKTPAASQRS
ncbi:acyltransferase [uncultured Jatrophihabitans sp.]|uniref:acyltransferase n=1 Tax=uncultured Jatrophihabitans sp. TaxID=1610747 RepID=UPI0035CBD045